MVFTRTAEKKRKAERTKLPECLSRRDKLFAERQNTLVALLKKKLSAVRRIFQDSLPLFRASRAFGCSVLPLDRFPAVKRLSALSVETACGLVPTTLLIF